MVRQGRTQPPLQLDHQVVCETEDRVSIVVPVDELVPAIHQRVRGGSRRQQIEVREILRLPARQRQQEQVLDAKTPSELEISDRSEHRRRRGVANEDAPPHVLAGRHVEPETRTAVCSELLLDELDGVGRDLGYVEVDVTRIRADLPSSECGSSDQHDRAIETPRREIVRRRRGVRWRRSRRRTTGGWLDRRCVDARLFARRGQGERRDRGRGRRPSTICWRASWSSR